MYRIARFGKAYPCIYLQIGIKVELIVDQDKLVAYPTPKDNMPSERWLKVIEPLLLLGAVISMVVAMITFVGGLVWVYISQVSLYQPEQHTVSYIIFGLVFTNCLTLAVVFHEKWKKYVEMLGKYENVWQGMVVERTHNDWNGYSHFYLTIEGNTAFNELRQWTHQVDPDKWSSYKPGDYVDFH